MPLTLVSLLLADIGTESSSDAPDPKSLKIGNNRFVKITEFRNKLRVDIREYYFYGEGELKPGKRGISLSVDEWKKLIGHMDKINELIEKETEDEAE